jgi:hypothetical protein
VFTHETSKNRKLLFETGKPDYLVLEIGPSGFVQTGGSQGCHWAAMRCSSSSQVVSGWWRGFNHDNFGGYGGS